MELRGLGRTATREGAHAREEGRIGAGAGGAEIGLVEDCAGGAEGNSLASEDGHRVGRREILDQDLTRAGGQAGKEPGHAADVGEGEDEGDPVRGAQVEAQGHALGGGPETRVGVEGTFRIGGGPGAIEEPADGQIDRKSVV